MFLQNSLDILQDAGLLFMGQIHHQAVHSNADRSFHQICRRHHLLLIGCICDFIRSQLQFIRLQAFFQIIVAIDCHSRELRPDKPNPMPCHIKSTGGKTTGNVHDILIAILLDILIERGIAHLMIKHIHRLQRIEILYLSRK